MPFASGEPRNRVADLCIAPAAWSHPRCEFLFAIRRAAGLAIGLALDGSLANLAADVMLIVFHSLKAGGYIEAGE